MIEIEATLKCKIIAIIICGLFISFVRTQLHLGSDCQHQKKQTPGVCKEYDKCGIVARDWDIHDIEPQMCGYLGKTAIVCCPIEKRITTTIRPTSNKSQFYCKKYASKVFEFKSPVSGAAPQNISLCGRTSVPLIFGGEVAQSQEFPHMALIGYGDSSDIGWYCGGTLISEEWVMTAAHCCYTQSGPAKFVRLGELNYRTTTDDTETQDFTVIEIKKHPKYHNQHYDDIGLLKLNKAIRFTAYVRPACLYPVYTINEHKAIATGWGANGSAFNSQTNADLLKVTLQFAPLESCNRTMGVDSKIDKGVTYETQLCAGAGPNDELKDVCTGDSGGPLQIDAEPYRIPCMYYIVGVVSFGKTCAILKRPSVFVRVSAYIPWIESVVWPN